MSLAIVTGASRGIGRVLALDLAADGHTVACLARSEDDLQALAAEHTGLVPIVCDLSDPVSTEEIIDGLLGEHGPCDILVNNAGYGIRSAIEDVPIDAWRREFEVNLFSCTRLIQKVLPGMRAAGSGTIVNISSVAGRIAPPFSGAYAATKFALEAMSDALRVEVAAFGVRVILVEPGPVATNFAAYAKDRSTAILESDDTQYSAGYKGFRGQVDALHRDAWTARAVADKTMAAIRSSRPPMRVACYGWTLRAGLFLRAVAPGLLDRVMARRTRA